MSSAGHLAQKGKKEMHSKVELENLKGRNNMKVPHLNSRMIILKLIPVTQCALVKT